MAENKTDLEGLRHVVRDTDFGAEIDSISELEGATPPKDDSADKGDNQGNDNDQSRGDIPVIEDDVPADDTNTPADEDSTDTSNQDNDVKFNTLLKTLGEQAKERNILDFNAEEFDKAEDKDKYFNDKLASTIENKVKEKFEAEVAAYKTENLPEEINELIELHKKGVPLHAILESDRNVAAIESIDIKDIEADTSLQKELVTESLRAQGWPEDKIAAKVKRYEDSGTLKDEGIEAKDILVNLEKERKKDLIVQETTRKQQAVQARAAKLQEITNTINTKDEILPGFKLTPEDKKTLIEGITQMTHRDKKGNAINALMRARIDDPMHDLKLAYFTLVLKGDLSKIKTKAESAATKSLKQTLDTQDKMASNQHSSSGSERATKVDKTVLRSALASLRK